jgi:hypothetical protein
MDKLRNAKAQTIRLLWLEWLSAMRLVPREPIRTTAVGMAAHIGITARRSCEPDMADNGGESL